MLEKLTNFLKSVSGAVWGVLLFFGSILIGLWYLLTKKESLESEIGRLKADQVTAEIKAKMDVAKKEADDAEKIYRDLKNKFDSEQ